MKEEPQDIGGVDGYDLGVLLGVLRQNQQKEYHPSIGISTNYPANFYMIHLNTASEVWALTEKELRGRLERLTKTGYLCHHKQQGYEEETWFITRKGLSTIRYGACPEERKLIGI
jgi:hypothetical protein